METVRYLSSQIGLFPVVALVLLTGLHSVGIVILMHRLYAGSAQSGIVRSKRCMKFATVQK